MRSEAPDDRTSVTTNGSASIAPGGPIVLLLKPAQAAEVLAISARKLWSLTASGEIPHVRIGRCVRYNLADLRLYAEARTTGGTVRNDH
jgi:excisionase family DNA binding protein